MADVTVPTAYLDNCVVSGLGNKDLQKDELEAAQELVERDAQGGSIRLVTSEIVLRELRAARDDARDRGIAKYERLAKVAGVITVTTLGLSGVPMAHRQARHWRTVLGALKKFLHPVDAEHVLAAIKNGAAFFVTTDKRVLGRTKREKLRQFAITALLPSEMLAILRTKT